MLHSSGGGNQTSLSSSAQVTGCFAFRRSSNAANPLTKRAKKRSTGTVQQTVKQQNLLLVLLLEYRYVVHSHTTITTPSKRFAHKTLLATTIRRDKPANEDPTPHTVLVQVTSTQANNSRSKEVELAGTTMPSPDTSVGASSRAGVDDVDHQQQHRQEPALAASTVADGDDNVNGDGGGSRQRYPPRPSNVVTTTSRCCSSIHHFYGCCSSRRSTGNNTSQTSSSDTTTSSSGGGYIQSLLTPPTTGSGKDDATTRSIRAINVLRCLMITFLIVTTSLMCSGIYMYANQKQHELFCNNYQHGSIKIMKTFHTYIQTSLMSLEMLSKTITSHAQSHNLTFPFVTVPDFELHGVNARILSKSHVIHYMPLIYDSNREAWEEYAMNHRTHIDVAFQNDLSLRLQQDEYFAMHENYHRLDGGGDDSASNLKKKNGVDDDRRLQGNQGGGGVPKESPWNETILDDGTGYHPRIWSIGAMDPYGDYPTTTNGGPYLPLWQRRCVAKRRDFDFLPPSLLLFSLSHTQTLPIFPLDSLCATVQSVAPNKLY